ncbi:MAG: phosphoribosyl-AMP cyclohydrolase [Candidatus Marinimicrobia bacterium]|nr:phosphoribosyl-AMP cyclohydrolase [Candidatus Neomarinimicrobiota bacterium]|tara:strand:- start:34154 stop:34540 length:387 start_codon:yes stop_codon:yes gene_type:complete
MNYDEVKKSVDSLNLKLNDNGLIPTIIQDDINDQVLMMAYMSPESLSISITEKRTCFWSRSRQVLWRKGDTSGHRQLIKSIALDCDHDTLLIRVEQIGAACHNGTRSCFVDIGSYNFNKTNLNTTDKP